MISKKMRDDVDVTMYSFCSFMDDKEYEKSLKTVIEKISGFVGKKTVLVEISTTHEDGKEENQRIDVEKFIKDGFEMPKSVKSFKFELFLKTESKLEGESATSNMKAESIYKSGVFVPSDYMQDHGKTQKSTDKNKEDSIMIDREILQDNCHGRIRFEGVKINEL